MRNCRDRPHRPRDNALGDAALKLCVFSKVSEQGEEVTEKEVREDDDGDGDDDDGDKMVMNNRWMFLL